VAPRPTREPKQVAYEVLEKAVFLPTRLESKTYKLAVPVAPQPALAGRHRRHARRVVAREFTAALTVPVSHVAKPCVADNAWLAGGIVSDGQTYCP
jgi:hypothetical protein